jgi:FkbM family methyltransferase
MLFDIKPLINRSITGIIQIGAHHGNEYDTLKNVCSNILMFEPQKEVFKILNNKLASEKNVIIENLAVGSSKGKMKMYIEKANAGQSSSLLQPALHTVQYPGIVFTNTEEVDVITLNEYFLNKDYNFNLMTIDVQGYELEVLKGASDILSKVDYILCEVNRAELYFGCPMVDDIDSYLSKYNFKREHTSWDGYTWGDAFYVRQNN